MNVTFRMVRIGELFKMNGNTYVKQSTRTARMIGMGPTGSYCRTFYIGQKDACTII